MNSEAKTEIRTAPAVTLANLVDRGDGARWFVVGSASGRERYALAELRAAGFVTYLPLRAVVSKKETRGAALFPGYLFTQLDLGGDYWPNVFRVPGVDRVITKSQRSGRPVPVALPVGFVRKVLEAEVDGFIHLAKKVEEVKAAPFKPGDKVRIAGGPCIGLEGVFQHGDANRVTILLSILGQGARLELTTGDVQAA